MMKKYIVLSISMMLGLSASHALAFGLPKIPGAGALSAVTGGGTAVDVDGFMAKAALTNQLFKESRTQLALMMGDKTQVAELQALLDTLKTTSDPKEKDAISQKIQAINEQVMTAGKADQDAVAARLAAASDESKAKAKAAAANFALAALQATELAPAGQSALSSLTSNPVQAAKLATKIGSIKTLIADISGIVGNSTMALTELPSIMSKAKIPVTMPTSAKDAPTPYSFEK
jgi:hypothetical protein